MCETNNYSAIRTTVTIPEASSTYRDIDELPDEILVRMRITRLFNKPTDTSADESECTKTIDEQAWEWFLNSREQLAFMSYLAVKKGICKHDDLNLKNFDDQELAVAVELLLSEYEPAIALNPIAERVRRFQLVCICGGYWDVLGFSIAERKDRVLELSPA